MDYSLKQALATKKGYSTIPVKVGQHIEIHENIGDGTNKRVRKFRGLVIRTWNESHFDGTFTVRGMSSGVSIEKIYPYSFSKFEKIILVDDYKIRRSKLYYIREKIGKDAKFKSKINQSEREKILFEKK